MTGEDWTWQDVPLDAYLDDAVGEAQPLPEPPGRTVREEAPLPPQTDAFPQDPPKPAPEAPKPGPSEPAGWLRYQELRAEGWNSGYAAEMAARHRREEADRALR